MPRRPGRPSLDGTEGHTKPMGVRFPDALRVALEDRALNREVSVSSVIRELVAEGLERDDDENPRR